MLNFIASILLYFVALAQGSKKTDVRKTRNSTTSSMATHRRLHSWSRNLSGMNWTPYGWGTLAKSRWLATTVEGARDVVAVTAERLAAASKAVVVAASNRCIGAFESLQGGKKALKEVARAKKRNMRETSSKPSKIIKPRCKYAAAVEAWVDNVVIGLGLCPWASRSHKSGHIRYVTCEGRTPSDVARLIEKEADSLTAGESVAPFSTTLIVCPHVAAWKAFDVFKDWVTSGIFDELEEKVQSPDDALYQIRIVPFHPQFLKWWALPADIKVGSVVQSHYWEEDDDGCMVMSDGTMPATVLNTTAHGARNILLRFDDVEPEIVPVEFLVHPAVGVRPALPDNIIHRAPHPTIHLIRHADLDPLTEDSEAYFKKVYAMWADNARRISALGLDVFREVTKT